VVEVGLGVSVSLVPVLGSGVDGSQEPPEVALYR
jgi:hypothetical protein